MPEKIGLQLPLKTGAVSRVGDIRSSPGVLGSNLKVDNKKLTFAPQFPGSV